MTKTLNQTSEINDYDNELFITVNSFSAEYEGCGTHKIRLNINIDKVDIEDFLDYLKEQVGKS